MPVSAPAVLTRLPQIAGPVPPGLVGGTLLLDLGWMEFLGRGVLWRGLANGARLVPLRPLSARRRDLEAPPPAAGPVDWQDRRAGLSLREVCRQNICVRGDVSLADLAEDPDPARHAAVSFAHARPMIDELARLLDRTRPARGVYPQGRALPAAILRALARQRGIACMALETCRRSDRLVRDDRSGITLAGPISREIHLCGPARPAPSPATAPGSPG